MNEQITSHLNFVYGPETAAFIQPKLQEIIAKYKGKLPANNTRRTFSQQDTILITYGDMVHEPGQPPLKTLAGFLSRHLKGVVNSVHLLPFYPYSSDDGFSVIDYQAVDPALGNWSHIGEIGRNFNLMFDAVINHISAQSDWFQAFLDGNPEYQDYFITINPAEDLSAVFRPRALPLLTEFQTSNGPRHVWTTFSPDQIDLNFANPNVLLTITDLLLFYVSQGAGLIRLDAIGFMWKVIGETCIHLPQTHRIIQLWRAVLDEVAPHVALITETNVPHKDNITYFGDGRNEAQMVYNFSLPPLTLHAFHTGNAEILTNWAKTITTPSNQTAFFNFLASHDGIGVTPARALLTEEQISDMAERVQALGGQVSFRSNSDGTQSAYELNINYLDALGEPDHSTQDLDLVANRFLASQAIMLAMPGVPGIYFHSLFGSRGWPEGVEKSGRFRTINREKLLLESLQAELAAPTSLRNKVFSGYRRLLQARANSAAFHPQGEYEIMNPHPALFAIRRLSPDQTENILCLHNVTNNPQQMSLSNYGNKFIDLITNQTHNATLTLSPYQILWLKSV